MKKITLTLMALFLVATVATVAMAYGPGRGAGKGSSAPCDARGFSALNLSEEQKTKLNASQEAHWKEVAPLREQMTAKRAALQKLWLEPNPDQAKIAAAQKELRTLRDQMQDKGTAFRLERLKVLTPEQKEKLATFAGSKGFGPGKWHGDRRGRGAGMRGGADCFAGGPGMRGNR